MTDRPRDTRSARSESSAQAVDPNKPQELTVPRPLSEWEREMIALMLSIDFAGRDIVRHQIEGAVVVGEYPCDPAVIIRPDPGAPVLRLPNGESVWGAVPVQLRSVVAPVEEAIFALLLVREGKVAELELYGPAFDGTVSKSDPPAPSTFEVTTDSIPRWNRALRRRQRRRPDGGR